MFFEGLQGVSLFYAITAMHSFSQNAIPYLMIFFSVRRWIEAAYFP